MLNAKCGMLNVAPRRGRYESGYFTVIIPVIQHSAFRIQHERDARNTFSKGGRPMDSSQFTVALLVANQFGVLTRVSGLFARRGFNIDSLTVGATQDPRFSRMTISAQGDDYVRGQIVRQLEKLEDVKTVQLMDESRTVLRSLMIVKVKLEKGRLSEIVEAANTFRASVIDLSPDSVLIEITGTLDKLQAFLEYAKGFGIIETSSTGPTAIGRSGYCLGGEAKQ